MIPDAVAEWSAIPMVIGTKVNFSKENLTVKDCIPGLTPKSTKVNGPTDLNKAKDSGKESLEIVI